MPGACVTSSAPTMSSALVTQVQSRGGLAVIRSLGARSIHVTACDTDRVALGFFSRYCRHHFVCPDPSREPEAFVDRVLDEMRRERYDVVIPTWDESLLLLAERRNTVQALTRFPFVQLDVLRDAGDKALSVERARTEGLRVPQTHRVSQEEDVRRAVASLSLPVIVRPRRSKGSAGVYRVERADAVWPVCQTVQAAYGPVIVQEYIPWGGLTYDVDILMNKESVARAAVVCKRTRTYPPLAGPTACGQAVDWPELRDDAVRLLQHMHWYGPAEVEFRIDPRDGAPVFMEINPRLWGSLYTGMVAGVDFPYLLYRLAMDGDMPQVDGYRTDLKARYFFTMDLLCMVTHPKKRSIARAWFGDFFDRRTKPFLLSGRDPMPLLGRLLATLVYGIRPWRVRKRLFRPGVVK